MSTGEAPARVHRRARGTGSIYAYDGGWRVRIRENGRDRAWQRRTYAAAAELLKEIRIQREEGTPMRRLDNQRLTVNGWLDEWLAQVAMARPRTHPFYVQKLAHVRPSLGSVYMDELDARDIRKALTDLGSSGLSPTMLHHVYRSLSAALNAATKEHRIARNPCAEVAAPRRAEFEARTLTVEQAQRLVELAWDTRLGPLITVALSTGMRAGELLALTWDDVDVKAGVLTVNKSVKWLPGGAHRSGSTKTRSSRRAVRVEGIALEALAEQRHRCAEALLASPIGEGLNLVFPSVHGTYWIPSGRFVRDFRTLLSQAGCPQIRFHDLRHTAGLFLTRSVGLVVASRVLGHSHPSVTATFYGHAAQEDFSAAAHAMSALIDRTAEKGRTIPSPERSEKG
jgi:integrase